MSKYPRCFNSFSTFGVVFVALIFVNSSFAGPLGCCNVEIGGLKCTMSGNPPACGLELRTRYLYKYPGCNPNYDSCNRKLSKVEFQKRCKAIGVDPLQSPEECFCKLIGKDSVRCNEFNTLENTGLYRTSEWIPKGECVAKQPQDPNVPIQSECVLATPKY